jgi:uncharacterized phage protein gp47/JayE
MAVVTPTYDELVKIAQDALKERAGITNFSESSVIGTLVNVMAAYTLDMYSVVKLLETQSSLSTATGANLDKIGELFGVTRLSSKEATTIGGGTSVMFTNSSAVQDITVPERTRIWSPRDYNVAFYTTSTIVVPHGSRAYTDVVAAGVGESFNVGPETLTQHNLSYSELAVTNILPIANGISTETDENYRYRISQALLAKGGSNEAAIRMRLLEVPGVKDAVVQSLVRGTGTVDIVIIPVARRVSQELLDLCQSAVGEVVAFGISAVVKAPAERSVDLTISVRVSATGDASLVRSMVSAAARGYIDNLPIGDSAGGGDLIYNELTSRVMGASVDVVDAIIELKVDGKLALNINQKAKPGERFYLQSIRVV